MKSKKRVEELDWQTSSVMRWLSGEEVVAYLDWDERRWYLWFEPTDLFTDWCEEVGTEMKELYDDLDNELKKIGVQEFCTLDAVNSFCEGFCGDTEPAMFYEDEWGNICGA